VYAADAFVVTPLTDDIATIENLVPSLQTDMMPAQGSNLSAALARSFALLDQSGVIDGNILVITDDIDDNDRSAIGKVAAQGHRLSIFGIGTAQGAPIPLLPSGDDTAERGGFLLDAQGRIVIPRLDEGKLHSLALAGGGRYISLSPDESDTASIDALMHSSRVDRTDKDTADEDELNADLWQEEGHWLLLPLLLLASLWFRRGWIAILIVFTLPLPQPAYADDSTALLQNLWLTPDQRAMRAFNDDDHARAADTFTDPRWQASALYRNGDYDRSAELLKDIRSSDAQYNRGNALANMGQYQQALEAYDEALSLDAGNEDAAYNREQVKKALDAMQQQEGQQPEQQTGQQDGQQQDGQQGQASDQQQGEQQDSDQRQQNAQQSSDDEQPGDEKTDTSEPGDQDQAQDLEQQDQQSPGQMSEQQQNKQEEKSLQQRDVEQEQQQAKQEMEDYLKSQQQQDALQDRDGQEPPQEVEVNPEQVEASITEKQQATRQWLRRIPDDPSGLLRRKFLYQYKHLPDQRDAEQPW
jgi:Ca-activated chloride channel family protein